MNIDESLNELNMYNSLYSDILLTESDNNYNIETLLSVLDESELNKVLSLPELPMKFLIGNYKTFIEEIQQLKD